MHRLVKCDEDQVGVVEKLWPDCVSATASLAHKALSFFCESLLERPVEIVTTNSLSPHPGPHILRDVEYVLG